VSLIAEQVLRRAAPQTASDEIYDMLRQKVKDPKTWDDYAHRRALIEQAERELRQKMERRLRAEFEGEFHL
jgi:hypothetical protein